MNNSKIRLARLALEACSLEELAARSKDEGFVIPEEDFLKTVQKAWGDYYSRKMNLTDLGREVSNLPETIPYHELVMEGISYRVYGVAHVNPPSEAYIKLVQRTCTSSQWLWEQNVRDPYCKSGIDVPDHSVTRYQLFHEMANSCIAGFWTAIKYQFQILDPTISSKEEKPDTKVRDEESSIFFPEKIELWEAMSLFWSPEELDEFLPIHLHLDLVERENPAQYTDVQRRSGYFAEFLKAWENNGLAKNICVGAGHTTEILYFLRNGIRDQKVVDLAHRHAEMLNTDPEQFSRMYERMRERILRANNFACFAGLAMPPSLLTTWALRCSS